MALHGEIRVNGKIIGVWAATRISHTEAQPEPDDYVTYDCAVLQRETLEGNAEVDEKFELTHRFGDGAVVLAARVLAKAASL